MPATQFNICKKQYLSLLNEEITLQNFLEGTLYSNNYANETSRKDAILNLLEFHKEDGGSPEIQKFEIAECSFNADTQIGKIKLKYEVFFTFGCADIHRSDNCSETSKFEINPEKEKLTLFITDHITRDTFEEF